jgi:uncharacterized protein (DUF608 family)
MEYSGTKTREISFPLGGIGTGCIGLAGNGGFRDIEIKSRPGKNTTGEFTHFAIKAEDENEVVDCRVLQGDMYRDYVGCGFYDYIGGDDDSQPGETDSYLYRHVENGVGWHSYVLDFTGGHQPA